MMTIYKKDKDVGDELKHAKNRWLKVKDSKLASCWFASAFVSYYYLIDLIPDQTLIQSLFLLLLGYRQGKGKDSRFHLEVYILLVHIHSSNLSKLLGWYQLSPTLHLTRSTLIQLHHQNILLCHHQNLSIFYLTIYIHLTKFDPLSNKIQGKPITIVNGKSPHKGVQFFPLPIHPASHIQSRIRKETPAVRSSFGWVLLPRFDLFEVKSGEVETVDVIGKLLGFVSVDEKIRVVDKTLSLLDVDSLRQIDGNNRLVLLKYIVQFQRLG